MAKVQYIRGTHLELVAVACVEGGGEGSDGSTAPVLSKVEVKEFIDYLKSPEKFKELGAKPPKVCNLIW